MAFTNYIYFSIFCLIIVFSPGPMNMLLMSLGAENGFKKTMAAQFGASSAYSVSLLIFSVGLTAVLQHYAIILKIIQYIGVTYILYLAWQQWVKSNIRYELYTSDKPIILATSRQLYQRGLITGLSNPKAMVMFTTVIPQFTKNTTSRISELFILAAIFLMLQFFGGTTYSYFGHTIKTFLHHEKYRKILYRGMAVILFLVAVMLAKA